MKVTYSSAKLSEIFNRIKSGSLSLPSFQRGFDWSAKDIVDFYNSVLIEDDPFGSIVIWNDPMVTKNVPIDKGLFYMFNESDNSPSKKEYLIDGQQRTTSFLLAIAWKRLPEEAKVFLGKIKKVYFDLSTQEFILVNKENTNIETYIPAHFFALSEEDFRTVLKTKLKTGFVKSSNDLIDNGVATLRRFWKVEMGITNIEESELNRVIKVFTLLNTSGKKLTPLNIVHANYVAFRKSFDLMKKYEKISEDLKEWKVPLKTILLLQYSITHGTISNAKIMKTSIKTKDIDFINMKLKKLLMQTTSELKTLGFQTFDYLPSEKILLLVASTVYDNDLKMLSVKKSNVLKKYIMLATLNKRYISGSVGSKIDGFNEDLGILKKLIDSDEFDYSEIDWVDHTKFDAKQIKKLRYNKFSADYRYVISMMTKYIMSFTSKTFVEKFNGNNKLRDLELHHIFPESLDIVKENELRHSVANLTPLESSINNDIGKQHPNKYLPRYLRKDEYKKYLLSENFESLEKFVDERSKAIADLINEKIFDAD